MHQAYPGGRREPGRTRSAMTPRQASQARDERDRDARLRRVMAATSIAPTIQLAAATRENNRGNGSIVAALVDAATLPRLCDRFPARSCPILRAAGLFVTECFQAEGRKV